MALFDILIQSMKMKRTIIAFFTITFATLCYGQEDIGTVFLAMPDSLIYGLTADARDILVADIEDTTRVKAATDLYNQVERLQASKTYLNLQTSKVGNVQIKLLPLINSSYIVCVVKTVCGGVCDSSVRFYSTDWNPITSKDLLPNPSVDWFIKEDADRSSQEFKNAIVSLDMNPMLVKLSPVNDAMTIEYKIHDYLSDEDYKKLKPYLTEQPKVLNWSKTSFFK